MADRFIIQGAAFNGNGTTSAEAASAGAAGAWNTLAYLTGTTPAFGTLSAGDVVYIRSKTGAGANADIVVTYNSADVIFGSTVGTATAPVTWVLDNGVTWAGISGTMTYSTTGAFKAQHRGNNRFIARTPLNWIIKSTYDGFIQNYGTVGGWMDGIFFDVSQGNTGGEPGYMEPYGVLKNCRFKWRFGSRNGIFHMPNNGQTVQFINCDFEQTGTVGGSYAGIFNNPNVYGTNISIIGGSFTGLGAVSSACLLGTGNTLGQGTYFRTVGFRVPASVPLLANMNAITNVITDMMATDDKYGVFISRDWGYASSRYDGNFPYISGTTIPDSAATGVSWQLRPITASLTVPMVFSVANKLYVNSTAAITVTCRFNISTTSLASNLNTNNFWLEVDYVDDTTGLVKTVTSRVELAAGSALAAGPSWSSAAYGAVALTSKQIAVTTPTTTRANTMLAVRVGSVYTPPSPATDMIFVDPDPAIS